MTVRVGDLAPDFALADTSGRQVTLSSFRGRPVVLIFLRWLG
jgi:peroxiredoxin